MTNPIEDILTEQIAGLRASEAMYVKQRADALAAAEAATVHAGGAEARADELQAALDAYRELLQPAPEPEAEPIELMNGEQLQQPAPSAGDPLIYRELREQLGD